MQDSHRIVIATTVHAGLASSETSLLTRFLASTLIHLFISDDRLLQPTITDRVLRSVGVRTGRTRAVHSPPKIDIYNLDEYLAPLDQQRAYRAHFQRHLSTTYMLCSAAMSCCRLCHLYRFMESCCMHRLNWHSLNPDARIINGVSGLIYPPTPCLRNHTIMLQLRLYSCPRIARTSAGHIVTRACNVPILRLRLRIAPQQTTVAVRKHEHDDYYHTCDAEVLAIT